MKNANSITGFLLLAMLIFLVTVVAEPPKPDDDATMWIDLDGDGFNDNAIDDNKDGIPDVVQPDAIKITGPNQSGIFASMTIPASTTIDLPLALQYDKRNKTTLAQCLTRFDLETSFGSGIGSGASSAGGGACAGGICH